ncbi:hypothetical protein BLJAPNOD_05505 [Ensifer sp. M14]|nr:hypothetical protein BLJAPNOD_05505 [Ensifer sp. M14]
MIVVDHSAVVHVAAIRTQKIRSATLFTNLTNLTNLAIYSSPNGG